MEATMHTKGETRMGGEYGDEKTMMKGRGPTQLGLHAIRGEISGILIAK
jgi:hypothetical protein